MAMESKGREDAGAVWVRYAVPLALAVVVAIGLRTVASPEVWQHLANGRAIVTQGALRADTLSSSMQGQAWTNVTWLYDVLLFLVWSVGGAWLTTLLHVGLVVGAFVLLLPHARRYGGDVPVALALLLCGWIMAPLFEISSVVASLIFPALYISLLQARMKPRTAVALLLVAQVLWTNISATFVWGPMICLSYAAQTYFGSKRKGKTVADVLSSNQLMLLTVGTAAATLLNPAFLKLHGEVLHALTDSHQAMGWATFVGTYMAPTPLRYMMIVAVFVGACGIVLSKNRLPFALTALAVLAALLTFRVHVFLAYFALLAFPFLSLSAHAVLVGHRRPAGRTTPFEGLAGMGIAVVLAVISLWAFTTNTYYVRLGHPAAFGLGVARSCVVSDDVIDLIQEGTIPRPLINMPQDGGFLSWQLRGEQVFVDGRQDLYGADFYHRLQLGLNGVDWSSFRANWQPGAILLNTVSHRPSVARVAMNLSAQNWALVYLDGLSAVYVPRGADNQALINNPDLQERGMARLRDDLAAYRRRLGGFVKPPVPVHLVGAGHLLMANRKYDQARSLFDAVTRGVPTLLIGWINLGICHYELGRYEEAVTALERASRLSPGTAQAWAWLGQAYEKTGRYDEAERAFERCQQLSPDMYEAFRGTP